MSELKPCPSDRLTYNADGCWQVFGADNYMCKEICDKCNGCEECPIGNAIDRLAEYENTGLTPEAIKSMMERMVDDGK